jgi:hypothetical protein
MDICVPQWDNKYAPSYVSNVSLPLSDIQLAPNPANDKTTLKFNLGMKTNVRIVITDIVGRIVNEIVNRQMDAGEQKFEISTLNMNSGIYNISIQTEHDMSTRRLSIVK